MKDVINSQVVKSQALFIDDRDELRRKIEALKELGLKISFTQGVFDMFHTGHSRYLDEAKHHGDWLIVAVDTDELVKSRKGPDRPFDPETERFEVVRSLRSVDIVVPKTVSEHQHDLLKLIHPDVFVISMSTGPEIQADTREFETMCGKVVNLERRSSTTTTAKLLKLKKDSGLELKNLIDEVIDDYLAGDLDSEIFKKLKDQHQERTGT